MSSGWRTCCRVHQLGWGGAVLLEGSCFGGTLISSLSPAVCYYAADFESRTVSPTAGRDATQRPEVVPRNIMPTIFYRTHSNQMLALEQAERYAGGVRRFDFDSGLAPYNLTAWRQWRQLTNYLDVRHVSELQPVGGNICTAAEAAPATGGSAAAAGADGVAAAGAAGSAGEVDVGGLEEEEGPESEAEGRLRLQLAVSLCKLCGGLGVVWCRSRI